MSEKNKFSISQVPDYIKQDYSYDSESNNTNETIGTAINTSLTTARGIRISPTMILNANNSAVVNSEGYITQSGPIVFQINLPLPFLYSDRSDKRIVVRAIWFWVKNNNELSSVFEDSMNSVKFEVVRINEGNYTIMETLDITAPRNSVVSATSSFPMGKFKSYQEGEDRWKFTFQRYLLLYDNGELTYIPSANSNEIFNIMANLQHIDPNDNLPSSQPYYYHGAATNNNFYPLDPQNLTVDVLLNNLFYIQINNVQSINQYGWSAWNLVNSVEILTKATEYDKGMINNEVYTKVDLSQTSSTNAFKFSDGYLYLVKQISTRRSDMNLVTCPVISTLTTMTNSRGITSMMSNTPYDHPTEFISSSLPYFLLAFAKENGELYTIPEGVKVNDYCRVFVELTCLY